MSEGARRAGVMVDVALNHWPYALALHSRNHPSTRHEEADVWELAGPAKAMILSGKRRCRWLLAAPDCTDHSDAKGAAKRSDRRRSLPNAVTMWARALKPNYILVENVKALRRWGPLDEHGQRIPGREGESFLAWLEDLRSLGYTVDHRVLRAHDFGAPTSRERLFIVARRGPGPIPWPRPTHGGPGQPPFRTAGECIDWTLPMRSIFGRAKPLAEKTLARIAEGVRRYVLTGDPFLVNLSHGGRLESLDEPAKTITAGPKGGDRMLVAPWLIETGNSERPGQTPRTRSLDRTAPTVTAHGSQGALCAAFLAKHFTGAVGQPLSASLGTVTCVDHHQLVAAFLVKYYGSGGQWQGAGEPLHTAPTVARFAPVTVHLDGVEHRIVDIRIRMLSARELSLCQGFPPDYDLGTGSEADKIRAIGNAVPPQLIEAIMRTLQEDES